MQIYVVGAGYAGLVTAAGLADLGHTVTCIDIDSDRIAVLRAGGTPLFEPGLEPILERSVAAGRLTFTDSYEDVTVGDGVVFVVVGSPPLPDGDVDRTHLFGAIDALASGLADGATVVLKSTVPVGTSRAVVAHLTEIRPGLDVDVVSNPEFLRQGAAVTDFLEPDRIVIGVESARAEARMRRVYQPLLSAGVEVVWTTRESAELIKYAANSYLALKLSFINEMADLAEASGAVIEDVARGIGLDSRIAPGYLNAGPGFGGSCLPKDTAGLLHTTRRYGVESRILDAVLEVNRHRIARLADRIERAAGGTVDAVPVAVLGITFKANTDDTRESPSLALVHELLARGAIVRVFDPRGMERARAELPETVAFASDEYAAVADADVAVVATGWKQFAALSPQRIAELMRVPTVVDLRRMWDPADMAAAGIRYFSIGRPDPV